MTAIPTRIIQSVRPDPLTPAQVRAAFRRLLGEGAQLRIDGSGRSDPEALLRRYAPAHRVALFDTAFYLSRPRQNPDLRFFVGWIVQPAGARGRLRIQPRILYKDVSLVWRSASHFVRSEQENWIGKGEMRAYRIDGEEVMASAEETTDLPLELQAACEGLNHAAERIPRDERAVALVLRRGGDDRIQPFEDFLAPRRRARADRRNRVNGGRPVARFTRPGDPTSLRFAPGYAPDFAAGRLGVAATRSRLYGGRVRSFRFLSENRRIQYLFFAGPRQVWIAPPQALTTELSGYGVRTVDVLADEELSIPGYEYHYLDETQDPPEPVSQIPAGFAGAPSEVDPSRADASPWLDRMPVVAQFRERVLRRRRAAR